MTKLYTDFANLYHVMYQSFINYDEEYIFYSGLMKKYQCNSILEISCGSGQLAKRFTEDQFNYTGADISEHMLNIAAQVAPNATFVKADMRKFVSQVLFDAVAITGRSVSYLVTNEDLLNTLTSLHKVIPQNGKLIFDFIDAESFFSNFSSDNIIAHEASYEGKDYKRESRYIKNLGTGFTWDWYSTYFIKENDTYKEIAKDKATLRAFLPGEIKLFLKLCGYSITEIITKKTYAFDTLVFVTEKD